MFSLDICCFPRLYIYFIFFRGICCMFFILACLLIRFALNFRFTFLSFSLTVLFNNLTAFF